MGLVRDLARQGKDKAVSKALEILVVRVVGRYGRLTALRLDSRTRSIAVELVLLGEGDRQALVQMAESAGFGDRLHFFVTDHPAPFFRASDLYVSMSASESFGLANLEALAAGLPAVCTAVGGVPEVVGNGAWLIPNDPSGNCPEAVQEFVDQCLDYKPSAHTGDTLMACWFAREEARECGFGSAAQS